MKTIWNFIKTTVLGGLLFLVPVVVLIVVLIQAFGLMLQVAEPLGELFPVDSIGGVALANIIVVLLILIICFIAGLFATKKIFSKFQDFIEQKILMKIPGYGFVKSITNSMKTSEEASENFVPVLVQIADFEQMGFEIERTQAGKAVVYLPGAPNPWAGTIVFTDTDKLRTIDISISDAMAQMERLGIGSSVLFEKK